MALPRLIRFGLPAVLLLVLAGFAAMSTVFAPPPAGDRVPAGSPVASPERGAGGGRGSPAPSPSAVASNATATRPPFIVGEITPIPNRGVSPTPTPSAAPPGVPARLGDYVVTLVDVRDPARSVFRLVQPTEGNRFVAVQVELKNNSTRTLAFSYLHFRLRDVGGSEHRATASTTLEPPLSTGSLSPGESVSGWVTFMPRQDSTLDLLYFQAPGMIGPRGQFSLQ